MISKLVDVFFFLIFKACQKIWDTLSPIGGKVCSNGHTLSSIELTLQLELLGDRFDHFEALLYQLKEGSQ